MRKVSSAQTDDDRQVIRTLREQLHAMRIMCAELPLSAGLDPLFERVVSPVSRLMNAEGATLFLVDPVTNELWSKGPEGQDRGDVRVEMGRGIAGQVAATRAPLRVDNAHRDPRFDPPVDSPSDLHPHSVAAVPLTDRSGHLAGVLQVLNHRDGAFSEHDLVVLEAIAVPISHAVENAHHVQVLLDKISELEAAAQRAEGGVHAESLTYLGRTLTAVAHDLRNPLTVISGYTQIMATEENPQEREARGEKVLRQIDELTASVSDLLTFARGDRKLTPVAVDLEHLRADVEESLLAHCTPRGIELQVTAQTGVVWVDLGRAKRIIHNLARNAIDALTRHGTLAISLGSRDGGLSLQVRDTGPGIPPDLLGRLFEPFFTANKSSGTGLGLAIVKRFVDDHQGAIRVESTVGEGTTFFVELPPAREGSPKR